MIKFWQFLKQIIHYAHKVIMTITRLRNLLR